MADPSGFSYKVHKNGDVVITHHGRRAAALRGEKARRFLSQVDTRDEQQLMARLTGNYRRGNERR